MGIKLFDDDADFSGDLSKIEINPKFAKRYEYNKKREELQRYEELKKQGRIDSSNSDDSSSEEEELVNPDKKSDVKFLEALIKVKNQDPSLKNKDAKLFNSDSENEGDSGEDSEKTGKKKEKKPMYLKDVVSKHLIEAGPEFDDEDEDSSDEGMENKVKSYSEEQEEMKREFLNAVREAEDGDEDDLSFLKVKEHDGEEDDDEDEIGGKLNEFFGEDEKLDNDSKFLKDYFRKRMWIDDGKGKGIADDKIEFSEDEDEIEKQEDYEREYNFRFEENAGDRILGHSRKVDGSVRKKDNARKQQRERKEERIAQAELERKEELKRLKNLKKKEIKEKLDKIREVAGIRNEDSSFLDEVDLEDEFDPDKYDTKMKEAFGDDYYKAEDVDSQFGSDNDEREGVDLEKPDFSKEDELLGLSKGWDEVEEPGKGFMPIRQKILKEKIVGEDEDGQEEKASKRKRKRKPSEVEKAIREELMEEYYKLDYEDTIGDLKTRFKYKTVEPKRYGLTPEEVLMMDDKELNQYVSLKKLAPYREKEWKVPRIKTLQLKQNTKELANGESSKNPKKLVNGESSKKVGHDTGEPIEEERGKEPSQPAESRRIKRRKRQAELKLSRARLMAYGKIPSSKSKSKKQQ